ncbi:MAG TPA: RIP metalloprotease RseP [Candidatus Binatia bacterium]|jgi:regulator of sigma E protease|nr:RIP metalloprotease RseP [Candidatus Binatia bacterium]
MSILKFVFIILEVLLLFNLLIFVHELGHFLAAKWRGLKIDRFAIWFGKPIWKKKINGVEYALGTIPAGGYVALPQMATMEAIEGKGESSSQPLPPISALDKIIVAVAGPLFSFLLAVAFAVVVYAVGRPVNGDDNSTKIGWVDPTGPAWKAGLRPGDEIVEIDDHPVSHFAPTTPDSITWRIVTSQGTNITIKYRRDGEEHLTQAVPKKRPTQWYERKDLRHILIMPAQKSIIDEVATNSPAALADLRRGDEIIALNDQKIYSPMAVVQEEEAMTNGPCAPVKLMVRRGAEQFEKTLQPEKPLKPAKSGPSFGILAWQGSTNMTLGHPSPLAQIREGTGQILATLGAVFSHKGDVGLQQLGGPVMIIRLYKGLFESEDGWRQVLWWSVVININLALLNILPFPVLDGGHIALALIEAVRRRPVSAKVLQYLQSACAILLIGFMLFIAFFDTGDWVRSARRNHEEPVVFAPKH